MAKKIVNRMDKDMSKEILVLASDGQAVLRAVNRLLAPKGLKVTQKKKHAGGDQRFLYLERLGPLEKIRKDFNTADTPRGS